MKLVINGETFDYDMEHRSLSEALAIEKAWGRRYAEWQQELGGGSAEAWAVFAWTVWRRDGREVDLADLLEGRLDFDYTELMRSFNKGIAEELKAEDPTSGAEPLTDPDGTVTTSGSTSEPSLRSSGSARGKPRSSASTSSTP